MYPDDLEKTKVMCYKDWWPPFQGERFQEVGGFPSRRGGGGAGDLGGRTLESLH